MNEPKHLTPEEEEERIRDIIKVLLQAGLSAYEPLDKDIEALVQGGDD